LTSLAKSARELVHTYHAEHPVDAGMPLETLRQRLRRAGVSVAQEAIKLAARKTIEGEPIVLSGDVARLEGFIEGGALAKAGGPLDRLLRALVDAGLKGLGEFALGEVGKVPQKELRAMLAKLVRDGVVVATGEQWFDAAAVGALRAKVREHLTTREVLTIAEFKDMSGLGRKQAIPLLELFDREGTTMRKGDDRIRGVALARQGGA
ncbi:MAG: SelB C-terminal domain-containing protein, partial [Polyangiaceae bacterium]